MARSQRELSFDKLIGQTPQFVEQINPLLKDAELRTEPRMVSHHCTIDQAVYFSMLRGFCVEPSITWPPALNTLVRKASEALKLSYSIERFSCGLEAVFSF